MTMTRRTEFCRFRLWVERAIIHHIRGNSIDKVLFKTFTLQSHWWCETTCSHCHSCTGPDCQTPGPSHHQPLNIHSQCISQYKLSGQGRGEICASNLSTAWTTVVTLLGPQRGKQIIYTSIQIYSNSPHMHVFKM